MIFLFGVSYGAIEVLQWLYMSFQQKRTADLIDGLINDDKIAGKILLNGMKGLTRELESPDGQAAYNKFLALSASNLLLGLTKELESKKDLQLAFGNLLASSAVTAWDSVIPDDLKDKDIGDILIDGLKTGMMRLSQDKDAQAAYETLLLNSSRIMAETTKREIEKTIDKELPVPKKYRWITAAIEKLSNKGQAGNVTTAAKGSDAGSGLSQL